MTSEDIKSLRTALEMSQQQLAERLKVSKWTVWGWENGRTPLRVFEEKLEELKEEL